MNGRDSLADSFDPRVLPREEKRHIGAQTQADLRQLAGRQLELPQAIQRQQASRRVRGPTPHTGLGGDVLLNLDLGAEGASCPLLQGTSGPGDQVIGRERFGQVLAGDTAIVPEGEMKRVAPVDHDENRLQEVITVRSTSGHVEEQVEFGRSLNIVQRDHGRIVAVGVRVRRCGSVEDQLQGRDRFRTGSTR